MRTVLAFLLLILFSTSSNAQTFTLESKDLGGQFTREHVFKGFGCKGENVSPQLSWENAPEGTKSFAVTMYDQDAPTQSGWWHWLMFDIPAGVNALKANAGDPKTDIAPEEAIQAVTSFDNPGYGGPCPPEGDGFHQYIITVYALKKESLGLNKNASPALISFQLNANALAKASLVVYHKR